MTTTVPSTPRPEEQVPYPVHVDADLDPHLSRVATPTAS